jgi:hypothetical protein
MRFRMIMTSAAALLFAGAVPVKASPVDQAPAPNAVAAVVQTSVTPSLALLQQQPPAEPAQQTRVTTETTTSWYADPIWIGVGLVALLVVILLIALASRRSDGGSTTTVIR